MMLKMKKILSLALSVLLLLGFALLSAGAEGQPEKAESVDALTATAMHLMKTRGEVSLTDASGGALPLQESMRLFSGYTLTTGPESLAGIGLDETKAVTVDEKSAVELNRDGRKLSLDLLGGAMYFSVSRPLEAEESYTIRTSTMILAIRGTSGFVEAVSETKSTVTLTSGHCLITAVTGEEQEIAAGERVVIDLSSGKAEFDHSEIRPEEYPTRLLLELAMDDAMLAEADAQNGSGFRSEVLAQAYDRAVETGELEPLAEAYSRQKSIVDRDILAIEPPPDPSAGGDSTDAGSSGTPSKKYYPAGTIPWANYFNRP